SPVRDAEALGRGTLRWGDDCWRAGAGEEKKQAHLVLEARDRDASGRNRGGDDPVGVRQGDADLLGAITEELDPVQEVGGEGLRVLERGRVGADLPDALQ